MGSYNLSTKAQNDLVGIYKFGTKYFGENRAQDYLEDIETFLLELADRPELSKDASTISKALKYYNYKAHVIFYIFDNTKEIFIVRVLGKRMNFIEHL